jgi:hypothetical protein
MTIGQRFLRVAMLTATTFSYDRRGRHVTVWNSPPDKGLERRQYCILDRVPEALGQLFHFRQTPIHFRQAPFEVGFDLDPLLAGKGRGKIAPIEGQRIFESFDVAPQLLDPVHSRRLRLKSAPPTTRPTRSADGRRARRQNPCMAPIRQVR